MPKLRVPVHYTDGIAYVEPAASAADVWSPLAQRNAVEAAAAAPADDTFAKFPTWISAKVRGASGEFLDAGCGYGRIAIPLLKEFPALSCVGIDASPVMLGKFAQLARIQGVTERVSLFCGQLQTLPFDNDQFSIVISSAVLLHLSVADVGCVISEFHRVLRPGGQLVLSGSFPNTLNGETFQYLPNRYRRRNGPVRCYTRAQVRRTLRAFGHVDIEGHNLTLLPRALGPATLPFGRLIRKANGRFTASALGLFKNTPFFVTHHDVVAVK